MQHRARRGGELARGALLGALALLGGCAGPLLAPNFAGDAIAPELELRDVAFYPQAINQCGPAALATVLSAAGVAVDPDELARLVYIPAREGSLQVELLAAVRRHNRIPYRLDATLDAAFAELAAQRPVLVLQNLGSESLPRWHYAVIVGYSLAADTIVLRSGTTRREVTPARAFVGTWARAQGWAVVVLRGGELPARVDADRYLAAVAAAEGVAEPSAVLSSYDAALARWPTNATALFGRANALYASGETVAAEQAFRRLLDHHPQHVAGLNNLAALLAERGCFREAQRWMDAAWASATVAPALRSVLADTQASIAAGMRAGDAEPAHCHGRD